MRYISTRGQTQPHSFSEAVSVGLAPDGGLFLPEKFPSLTSHLKKWEGLSYSQLCYEFMKLFATDIPEADLKQIVESSYTTFTDPAVAPLKKLSSDVYVLELFHGPTLAFKDFALQLLGNLYSYLCSKKSESINVLGATSGDTGAAAIHGLLGKSNTAVFILYPNGRVSALQERQMACLGADNVYALAIDGSFDDAQAALKEIFADQDFRIKHRLSAVNSINLARVLAQCVYYLYAWLQIPEADRSRVEFVVPTGNFGNVLAGWHLTQMGVSIGSFKVATNQNDILFRLFNTGEYKVGQVEPSLAPSMDIQVASNFERLLYYRLNADSVKVREAMQEFKTKGSFVLPGFKAGEFSASRCVDKEIPDIIKSVYKQYGLVIDPHTACGFKEHTKGKLSIVLATASPAKFPDTIQSALGIEPKDLILEKLKTRPIVKTLIKADPALIKAFITKHGV